MTTFICKKETDEIPPVETVKFIVDKDFCTKNIVLRPSVERVFYSINQYVSYPLHESSKLYIKSKHVKIVQLCDNFNGKIFFPEDSSIEILKFGYRFNLDIDYLVNLKKLKSLYLGDGFNKSLDFIEKMESLEYLRVGNAFRRKFKNFPDTLKILKIECFQSFNEQQSYGGEYFDDYNLYNLPLGLKKIFIPHGYDLKKIRLPWDCEVAYDYGI